MDPNFVEALSAAEGGAISTVAVYPLEVLTTTLQAFHGSKKQQQQEVVLPTTVQDATSDEGEAVEEEAKKDEEHQLSVREAAQQIMRSSGVKGFFTGVDTSALQSAIEKFIYFYAYSTLRGITKLLSGGEFSATANLVVGYLAEAVHLPITIPLEVVITKIITSGGRIKSMRQAFRNVVNESGIAGLYRGGTAYIFLCLKPAIQYTVFEQLRKAILRILSERRGYPIKSLTALQAFFLGALSRAIATILIFPCMRAKVLLMADKKEDDHEGGGQPQSKDDDVFSTIRRTVQEEGAVSLFQGIGPELTRGVLSAAFMLAIKEKLFGLNKAIFLRPRN